MNAVMRDAVWGVSWLASISCMCGVPQDRAQLQAVATRLVRAGASLEVVDLEGRTALHLAAGCGDAAMVAHLLHLGADVNATDSVGGETAWWQNLIMSRTAAGEVSG